VTQFAVDALCMVVLLFNCRLTAVYCWFADYMLFICGALLCEDCGHKLVLVLLPYNRIIVFTDVIFYFKILLAHVQELHCDNPQGPFAYVLSLTSECALIPYAPEH